MRWGREEPVMAPGAGIISWVSSRRTRPPDRPHRRRGIESEKLPTRPFAIQGPFATGEGAEAVGRGSVDGLDPAFFFC